MAARSCLDPARDLKERALEAVAAVESDGGWKVGGCVRHRENGYR